MADYIDISKTAKKPDSFIFLFQPDQYNEQDFGTS